VLIVDDDEKILRILKLQLQHNQFEVFTATNGNDALDIFMTEQNIPLILLDIMLPGIDGIALCKKFKNVNPAVKVIIVSAKDQSKDVVQGLNSGADDYSKAVYFPKNCLRVFKQICVRTVTVNCRIIFCLLKI
jgi:DNA-binding response OmpR family regulator